VRATDLQKQGGGKAIEIETDLHDWAPGRGANIQGERATQEKRREIKGRRKSSNIPCQWPWKKATGIAGKCCIGKKRRKSGKLQLFKDRTA